MSPAEIVQLAQTHLAETAAQPLGLLSLLAGAIASALVIAGAMVKTIIPLRWLAVGSSVGFVVYAAIHPAPLLLALHAVLLPVNLYRAIEMVRLVRRVERAASNEDIAHWLRPHMRKKRLKAGTVLFKKGEIADRLYFLAEGELEFVERGRTLGPGRMFGEIAFFAPDRRRTATARCRTDCTVLSIDETTFRQLYFQDPSFGFEVVRLIAGRLTQDVARLEERITHLTTPGDSLLPASSA